MTEDELKRFATELSHRRRKDVPGTCAVCGTPFVGYAKKQFCSHKCAQRAYKARLKDRAAEEITDAQP
jgi:hypothetical protein